MKTTTLKINDCQITVNTRKLARTICRDARAAMRNGTSLTVSIPQLSGLPWPGRTQIFDSIKSVTNLV